MATRLDTAQPSNHNTDANFPHGAPRNNITPNDKTGTKWVETWVKDIEALKQGILIDASVTPNNVPDTALTSQWRDALKSLTFPAAYVAASTGVKDLSGLYPWARGGRFYLIGGGGGGRDGGTNLGGGGGGSGGIKVFELLVADGFAWTFTVSLLGAAGTGGSAPTDGGSAVLTLDSGHDWGVQGGDAAASADASGGDGHCGGGSGGGTTNPGGGGGLLGGVTDSGDGSAAANSGGTGAYNSLSSLRLYGAPVSPQDRGTGGSGTAGNGGGGGAGHLTATVLASNGGDGDSGVGSGGKAGEGFGGGGGGGGGTSGAFLGPGGDGAPGLIMVVPF